MKKKAIAGLVAAVLTAHGVYADVVSVNVKAKHLAEVLRDVQTRSGVEFSWAPDLADDAITQTVSDSTWEGAIQALLMDYNYRAAWNAQGRMQKVILYSRSGSEKNAVQISRSTAVANEDLLIYEPTPVKLPEKYRNFNARSVAAVTISVEKLVQMKMGEKINLTLPIGQFEVVHDNLFEHENGDLTWVGYLNPEGRGYRVIVTFGEQGSLGQVVAPGGVYNLDSENGRNWLVDVSSSALNPGSFDNDEDEGSLAASDRQLAAETTLGSALPDAD